jgi:hypothetical protein
MLNKIDQEFVIVGDNNYWYAQGMTDKTLKQAKQSLKLTAKAIKNGSPFADDEQLPEPATLYLYVGKEVARINL